MISVIGAIAQAMAGRFQPTVPVSLFFRQGGYSVGEVSLDLVLSEDHSKEAMVATYPLQTGTEVSDHIVSLPRSGTMKALISNFSLATSEGDSNAVAQDIYAEAESTYKTGLVNRAQEAWTALKGIMDRKELVTIVTVLEVYENVAITSLSTSMDGDTGDALEIDIGFQQVNKVKLREDKVEVLVQPTDMNSTINQKSAIEVNSGQQVGQEATEAEESQLVLEEVGV